MQTSAVCPSQGAAASLIQTPFHMKFGLVMLLKYVHVAASKTARLASNSDRAHTWSFDSVTTLAPEDQTYHHLYNQLLHQTSVLEVVKNTSILSRWSM